MTEVKWATSTDPGAMLVWARRISDRSFPAVNARISDRKLRLFAVACCRQVWHLLTDERSRRAVEVAERYADGNATEEELVSARGNAAGARNWMHESPTHYPAWLAHVCTAETASSVVHVMQRQTELSHLVPSDTQAALLRCIAGNPFRPVTFPINPEWTDWHAGGGGGRVDMAEPTRYLRPDWLTPTVLAIAQAAYDQRDFGRLPVLADALEDAGCDCEDILQHLRGRERCPCCLTARQLLGAVQSVVKTAKTRGAKAKASGVVACSECRDGWIPLRGPHARGCWVVDLITGRE